MEITKKEVEELIGDKVLTYKVIKSYRGYKVTKVRVVAIKAKDSKVHEHIYGFCEHNISTFDDHINKDIDDYQKS